MHPNMPHIVRVHVQLNVERVEQANCVKNGPCLGVVTEEREEEREKKEEKRGKERGERKANRRDTPPIESCIGTPAQIALEICGFLE